MGIQAGGVKITNISAHNSSSQAIFFCYGRRTGPALIGARVAPSSGRATGASPSTALRAWLFEEEAEHLALPVRLRRTGAWGPDGAPNKMIRFGTDGWRGVVGRDFTFENVERVAQAYADVLNESGQPIPLGYDRRFLSDEFARAVAVVLAANRLPVTLSERYCPTPCISWMTKSSGAVGGVMITASHNPYPWNGIKFKEPGGLAASPRFTSLVEQRIEENEKAGRRPLKIPWDEAVARRGIRSFDPLRQYVRALRAQVDILKIRRASWKIAYDPLFGAGAGFLKEVLGGPASRFQEIHGEENPGFGGLHPEPIEKNLGPLMRLVRKGRFDVGLSTDGDADRIGAADERGRFVNPGEILALLLRHLLEKGRRGEIVKTVSTTQMVDRIAARFGLKVHETPIGFKHISQKFQEGDPLIGGEESGGIGIPSHLYERDGLLCALLLLEIMSVKKKRLGELLKDLAREIGPFVYCREDLPLSPEEIARVREKIDRLQPSRIGSLKVVGINRLDGLKFLLEGDGWLLIRPSGTEPLVRLYAEAPRLKTVLQLIREGHRLLGVLQSERASARTDSLRLAERSER